MLENAPTLTQKLGEIQLEGSVSSSLGLLLSYPILWPSSKVVKFLQCAYNKVKLKPPFNNTNEIEGEILNFRKEFDNEAVYAVTDNWTEKIPPRHFNEHFNVKNDYGKNCGRSAVQLLRLLRNQAEHKNELEKTKKQELQWISSKDDFDEHSFLLYWTTKFPLFVSFTWLKFSHFFQTTEAFKDYYPAGFTVPVDTGVKFQFENYITMLHQGLQEHLEKGGMLKRYEIYSARLEPCILELRSLPPGIIPSILSTNLALQVRFLEKEIQCQWDCIEEGSMVSSKHKLTSYPGDYNLSPLQGTLFLLSFNKNHLNILKMRFEGKKVYHPERIIICTNFENTPSFQLKKAAKHFTEIHNYRFGDKKPLKWGELSTAVRSTILDKNIKFQRKSMRLRSFINMGNESPELESKLESLLSSLSGERLRLLLMDKKPEFFTKLTPPSEPPIYVERKLSIKEKTSSKTFTITIIKEEDFLDQLKTQRPIIIADKPGMGKTLVLSSFARKLLKFKNHYVLYMHINEFVKRMLKLTEAGVVTKEKIISALSKLVSDPDTEFEENLVKLWLEETSGREQIVFELMLDGRDELSSETDYNSFVDSFLEIVRNKLGGVVRLWITLRDHMMEDMEKSLDVRGYKICPYVKSDQIDFLTEYWMRTFKSSNPETKISDSANGELMLFAERCIDSHSFSKSASTFSNFSKEIAGVPLQCRMLGEIYQSKANQIIVGDTTDICVIEINSATELYEKMVEAKLEDFLKTKNALTNIDMNNGLIVGPIRKFVTSVHIRLAIKCIFSSKCYEDLDLCDSQQSQETSESFFPYGLIITEDPLLFVHRTFAEYFVSLFIHKCLRGEFRHADAPNFAKFLLQRILQVKLEQFFHDPENQQTKNTATFMTPVICYFFDTMINPEVLVMSNNNFVSEFRENFQGQERKESMFDCSTSLIVAAIRHDFFNIFKLLIHYSENFYSASQQEHMFILIIAAQTTRLEFFKFLCVEIENWNGQNGNDDFRIPAEILYSALRRGRFEIVKFLVEEKGFGPETWKGHQVDDKKRYSVIHHCVCKSRKDSKQMLENKEHILQYLADLDRTILEEVDSRGRAPLLSQLETSIRLKKKLLEVGADPNAVEVEVKQKDGNRIYGKYRNSGLHWSDFIAYEKGTPPEAYHELLSSFLDHGYQINLRDVEDNTTLHCAIRTYQERILDETLQLFETNGADFNAKSQSKFYNGGTVLHWVIKKGCDIKFIQKLMNHGCSLNERNNVGETPLDIALAKGLTTL